MTQYSSAAQILIAIIPIVGIVMGSVVVFFYLLWGHRERMQLIARDMYVPIKVDFYAFCLLSGILLVAIGLTLSLVFGLIAGFGYNLLGGLIPLSLGLGFLAFYGIGAKHTRT